MASGRQTIDQEKIGTVFEQIVSMIAEAGLTNELQDILRECGVGEEGQNEPRQLALDQFMRVGDPYEVLRMTFTEPDAEDL